MARKANRRSAVAEKPEQTNHEVAAEVEQPTDHDDVADIVTEEVLAEAADIVADPDIVIQPSEDDLVAMEAEAKAAEAAEAAAAVQETAPAQPKAVDPPSESPEPVEAAVDAPSAPSDAVSETANDEDEMLDRIDGVDSILVLAYRPAADAYLAENEGKELAQDFAAACANAMVQYDFANIAGCFARLPNGDQTKILKRIDNLSKMFLIQPLPDEESK